MFSKRVTATAGFYGMLAGIFGCFMQYGLWRAGVIHYPTPMAATLYLAIWGGAAGLLTSLVVSVFTKPKTAEELKGLVWNYATLAPEEATQKKWLSPPVVLAILVGIIFLTLNIVFR
jgi:SSS family solute:Na+ symporter